MALQFNHGTGEAHNRMETVLIILGVLGFGAVLISAYVFTVAARNYVSDSRTHLSDDAEPGERLYVLRSLSDRRLIPPANTEFPLQSASGEIVAVERRAQEERRQQASVR